MFLSCFLTAYVLQMLLGMVSTVANGTADPFKCKREIGRQFCLKTESNFRATCQNVYPNQIKSTVNQYPLAPHFIRTFLHPPPPLPPPSPAFTMHELIGSLLHTVGFVYVVEASCTVMLLKRRLYVACQASI